MKLTQLTKLTAMFALIGIVPTYAASNDALLDLLVRKGVLTQDEATEVAAELKEENKGVTFSAKGNDTVKVRFKGRMHYQYDNLGMDANGEDLPSANHFYFRRLRMGAEATHESGIFAEMVLEMAEDDFGIDTAIAGYEFNDFFTGIIGYQKVPFGFEEMISSNSIKTVERSVANRFIVDDIDFAARHSGLHAEGNLGAGFSYAAAVVNGVQGEGSRLLGSAESSNDLAFFGSLRWEGSGLTLGVDGGHKSNAPVVRDDVTAFTGYAHYNIEGFDILGEYFHADMGEQEDFNGYALRLAYKIGKFEPVVRYSYAKTDRFVLDTDELVRRAPEGDLPGPADNLSNVRGTDNEIESYYAGLNYYWNKSVSLLLGYEIAEAENGDGTDQVEIDGFRARVKVLW